jgi:hypothetical protein
MDCLAAMGAVQLEEVAPLAAQVIGCVVIPFQPDGLIAMASDVKSHANGDWKKESPEECVLLGAYS